MLGMLTVQKVVLLFKARQTCTAALLFCHAFHKPLQLSILQLQQPSVEMDFCHNRRCLVHNLCTVCFMGRDIMQVGPENALRVELAGMSAPRHDTGQTLPTQPTVLTSPAPSFMLWIQLLLPSSYALFLLLASCSSSRYFMPSSYTNCLNTILGVSWYQEIREVNNMEVWLA